MLYWVMSIAREESYIPSQAILPVQNPDLVTFAVHVVHENIPQPRLAGGMEDGRTNERVFAV